MGTTFVSVTGAGARRKDDIRRPGRRAPKERENPKAWQRDMVKAPNPQKPEKPIHGLVDGEMYQSKSNGGSNAKREPGAEKKMHDRKRRERERGDGTLPSEDEGATSAVGGKEKIKEAAKKRTPIQQEEEGSYIRKTECR